MMDRPLPVARHRAATCEDKPSGGLGASAMSYHQVVTSLYRDLVKPFTFLTRRLLITLDHMHAREHVVSCSCQILKTIVVLNLSLFARRIYLRNQDS